jgi:hypothetical protein
MMNVDGDRLAIDDFMDKESLDDLVDFVCAPLATPPTEPAPCIGKDPTCPCQDGGACHYKDAADGTKGWPAPQAEPPNSAAQCAVRRVLAHRKLTEFEVDEVVAAVLAAAAPQAEPASTDPKQ